MKDKLTLKRLAEEYYYAGRELTEEQYDLLKNSKYASILKEKKTVFDNLFENALPSADKFVEEAPAIFDKDHIHHSPFYNHVDRIFIDSLVDGIKDKYNLGIENTKSSKYEDVDLNDLKSFIKDFIETHKAKSELDNDDEIQYLPIKEKLKRIKSKHLFHHTEGEVNEVVNHVTHDIYDIMDRLLGMSSNGY
jgi:hypothetical protein